jgi:cytochrome b subunit of formate dehydrogenase
MARRPIRKTDFGTVLLHWTLVGLLLIALATGLRIALDGPHDLAWLHALDFLLPQTIVWTAHIPAGAALIALAISYALYISKGGLARRVRPDIARLKGIAGKASARYGALNILLYWMLFGALGVELVTGSMLYIGYGGWAAEWHYAATWVIVGYVPAHIAIHYAIGGRWQLLRVLNPGRLAPRPAEFDPFELIADLVAAKEQQAARRLAAPEAPRPSPPPPPGLVERLKAQEEKYAPPQRPQPRQPDRPGPGQRRSRTRRAASHDTSDRSVLR